MGSPELTVFDVGHGNCSLILDAEMAFVVDTPQGNRMLNLALAEKRVNRVDAVLISHADADHIGGLLSVLSNPGVSVERIYLNPDVERDSDLWHDLRVALADARQRGKVKLEPSLTISSENLLQLPRLQIDILAPSPENAISGVSGTTIEDDRLSANGMSVVVRVRDENCRGVLLPGDMDSVGFKEALKEERGLEADVLVFPHHGGRPGSEDPWQFAFDLTGEVQPSVVIFSLSRGRQGLPRPDIVDAVRAAGSEPHIACTQLSRLCAKAAPNVEQPYLSELPSRGRAKGHCCAGTVELHFTEDGLYSPQLAGHAAFVEGIPEALCQVGSTRADS